MKKKPIFIALIAAFAVAIIIASSIPVYHFLFENDCTHEENFEVKYDSGHHWKKCAECGAEFDKETHEMVLDGDSVLDCRVASNYKYNCNCGYSEERMEGPYEHNVVDGQCTRCQKGLVYELNSAADSYRVTGYRPFGEANEAINVTVPATFRGLPVTDIGNSAFMGVNLASITLPEGLKSIGSRAFFNVSGICEIVIPDSVTYIGESCFANCTAVKTLTLGAGVESVGEKAFFGMKSLEKLYYNSKGITEIGETVMWGTVDEVDYKHEKPCELILGEGVEWVATKMFTYQQLSKIHIPSLEVWFKIANVTENGVFGSATQPIGTDGVYLNGEPLREIVVPESVTIVMGHFLNCTSIENIVVHDKVTYIDEGVFANLNSVEYVSISCEAKYICNNAFINLVNLKELHFNAPGEMLFNGFCYAGINTENGFKLYVGERVTSINEMSILSSAASVSEVHFPSREKWAELDCESVFLNHNDVPATVYYDDEIAG